MMDKKDYVWVVIVLVALASLVSAAYLTPVRRFAAGLFILMRNIGNALAILMFIYGAGQYIYTADDPGGRKKALNTMVAAVIALVLLQMVVSVICAIVYQLPEPLLGTVRSGIYNLCP